ncbi:hypothetical protein FWF93_02160 [Candidatus Saccharibacteria bacterium]|nr:hypothetical protein [Candidatus Saccharibacteria bacterium]
MEHKNTSTKKKVTTTYSCPSCKHTYSEDFDLTIKKESEDPDFDKDRTEYCLLSKEKANMLRDTKYRFEQMAELGKKFKERKDNKQIYDAVKELKKPKIAELTTLLTPVLEKGGYSEFNLDKPEMGRDVTIGFNCLDTKSERDDYTSKKELKKIIDKALNDTNWRLMSDGIHYRLGYLNGRIRAYEQEDDLVKLVAKDKKLKYKKVDDDGDIDEIDWNSKQMKTPDGKTIIF